MNSVRVKCRLHFEKFEDVGYGLEIFKVGKNTYKILTNTGFNKDELYFTKLEQVKRYAYYFISRMNEDVIICADIDICNSTFKLQTIVPRKNKDFDKFINKINEYLDDIELLYKPTSYKEWLTNFILSL